MPGKSTTDCHRSANAKFSGSRKAQTPCAHRQAAGNARRRTDRDLLMHALAFPGKGTQTQSARTTSPSTSGTQQLRAKTLESPAYANTRTRPVRLSWTGGSRPLAEEYCHRRQSSLQIPIELRVLEFLSLASQSLISLR